MSKNFAITFAIGLTVIAAAVAGVLYMQRGAHLVPKGAILKVRTQKMDDSTSVMVVDLRLGNNSDYPMIVRDLSASIETADGGAANGTPVAADDVKDVFRYFPVLGEQFNETLKARDRVPPKQSIDRQAVFRFEVPESALESRKKVTVRIEDVTGPVAELTK